MKKITKDGKEYAVIEKTVEEHICLEDVREQLEAVEAMIIATNNTLNDYVARKEQLEKLLN